MASALAKQAGQVYGLAATHERETAPLIHRDLADAELMTATETARFLKVPVTWVYEHVRPGAEDRLPVVKIGKYLRFDRRDLQAYIDAKRTGTQNLRRYR
jgi:excisionase family DNA binding protein